MAEALFQRLAAEERRHALRAAQAECPHPAFVLEKDIWVVATLGVLFDAPFGYQLVFKGGSPELDEMMVEAYVSGVSQRKMGDVTEALMGERVGRSTVSRVAKRLDEAVEGLRRAPIEGPHPYLYLDATFLDARWARKVENVSALVAYAVGPEGHRRAPGRHAGR